MPTWAWVLLAVFGIFLIRRFLRISATNREIQRLEEEAKEFQENYRRACEEERASQYRAERDEKYVQEAREKQRDDWEEENRSQENSRGEELESFTLVAEPDETVAAAADRLGVTIVAEEDGDYFCRYEDFAYRVESREVGGGEVVAFVRADPGVGYCPDDYVGWPELIRKNGWREVARYREEKPYSQQMYDGDDYYYITIFVDTYGRAQQFKEIGPSEWMHWRGNYEEPGLWGKDLTPEFLKRLEER